MSRHALRCLCCIFLVLLSLEVAGCDERAQMLYHGFPNILMSPGRSPGLRNSSQFQAWLHRRQNPLSCENVRYLAFLDPQWAFFQGLGHLVWFHVRMLMLGLYLNRVVVFRPGDVFPWTVPVKCQEMSLGCFLMPLSNCTSWATTDNTLVMTVQSMLQYKATVTQAYATSRWNATFGRKWLEDQLTAYILRPRPLIAQEALRYQRQLFSGQATPQPLVHLHVRYGDLVEMAPEHFVSIENYMKAIESLGLNATDVYLSTETGWVITEVQQQFPHIRWHYTRVSRAVMPGLIMSEIASKLGPHELTVEQLSNLFLTVLADAVVCIHHSNWCRVLASLQRFWRPEPRVLWADRFVAAHNLSQTVPPQLRGGKSLRRVLKEHGVSRKRR
eukprot:EG_transcript_12450